MLRDSRFSPSALIRDHRAQRREERAGKQAMHEFKGWAASGAGRELDQRDWAIAAADAILTIAKAAEPEPTGGGAL